MKHIYALASAIGAIIYVILVKLAVGPEFCAAAGCIAVIALRFCSAHFRWNMPRTGKIAARMNKSEEDREKTRKNKHGLSSAAMRINDQDKT